MDLQQKLQQMYMRLHARQAARDLETMSPRVASDILSDTEEQDAAAVMEFILPRPAAEILNHFSHEKGAKIIAALNPSFC